MPRTIVIKRNLIKKRQKETDNLQPNYPRGSQEITSPLIQITALKKLAS